MSFYRMLLSQMLWRPRMPLKRIFYIDTCRSASFASSNFFYFYSIFWLKSIFIRFDVHSGNMFCKIARTSHFTETMQHHLDKNDCNRGRDWTYCYSAANSHNLPNFFVKWCKKEPDSAQVLKKINRLLCLLKNLYKLIDTIVLTVH